VGSCGDDRVPTPQQVAPAADWIRPPSPKRHAVLIVIDTLRADAVELAPTPHLDALAAGGQVRRAWSGGTWTAPSMVSMFTGLPVRAHGWDFPFPRFMDEHRESYPPVPDHPTLGQVLDEAGFRNDGIVANAFLRQGLGFERGFDSWTRSGDRGVVSQVEKLVREWDDDERHFLYVHFLGPHHPLRPTRRAAKEQRVRASLKNIRGVYSLWDAKGGRSVESRNYRRAYKAVVQDSDRRVGAVLDALGSYRDDAAIIVTSDHGEMLGEHDQWGHEHFVWEQITQVPFIAEGLGPLPDTVNTTAVPGLITSALGVPHDWPDAGLQTAPIVSQRQGKVAMTVDGRMKGIWDPESFPDGGFAAFDLKADPYEESPLDEAPAELVAAHADWQARVPLVQLRASDVGMSGDVLGMLEQLGYMGDGDGEEEGDDAPDGPDVEEAADDESDDWGGERPPPASGASDPSPAEPASPGLAEPAPKSP
jgi:hypothetical protein